jgi:hypothetical protein
MIIKVFESTSTFNETIYGGSKYLQWYTADINQLSGIYQVKFTHSLLFTVLVPVYFPTDPIAPVV